MTTEQAPREPAAEALELASVLRCMTECGAAPDDLWTRDQPDGDPFVARAAELLEHFARALVASQAQPAAEPSVVHKALEAAQEVVDGVPQWHNVGHAASLIKQALKELDAAAPPWAAEPQKLWLWKNFVDGRPEYWAFDNPFPIHLDNGDPQTLGEPCGYAIFKPSRQGRTDVSEAEVLRRIHGSNCPRAEPRQDSVHAGESSSPPTTKRGYLGSTVDGGIDDH